MQASVDELGTQDAADATWMTRITSVVLAARAAEAARQAFEEMRRRQEAEAFEERRQRCTLIATEVLDRTVEVLGRLGTTARTTRALRDSVSRMPRAFDVGVHVEGDDLVASLVLTVVEGLDAVKTARRIAPRRLGADVREHVGSIDVAALSEHAVGELVATLVEDLFGADRPAAPAG